MTQVIDDAVRRNAIIYADRLAVAMGHVHLTWAEFYDRADRLARGLAKLGIQAGDRVVLMQNNGPAYLISNFAVWMAGAVLVGISNKLQADEVAYILDDAEPKIVICSDDYVELLTPLVAARSLSLLKTSGAPSDGVRAIDEVIAAEPSQPPRVRRDNGRGEVDLAVLGYTSGTTGRPKGAMLSHRNMLASATSVAIERSLTCDDRYLFATPMNHISAISFCVMTSLVGGSFVIPEKFDPASFVEIVRREPITFVFLVPTMLHMVIEHLQARGEAKLAAKALRLVCYGAAPILPELLRQALTVFECGFSQAYGMTEASPVVSVLPPAEHVAAAVGQHSERLKSAGRATLHARIRVVDANDKDCQPEQVGEIVLAGPSLLEGYWKRPEATAQSLRGGWFYSGDLGYLDRDGYLYVVGREHDMIISGGINVYPREVELTLAEHPAVAEVAVVGLPDRKWGEAVTAFVVARADAARDAGAILAWCDGRLAAYKKPKQIIFVDDLPRNATGKILKRELRERRS